MKKTSRYVLATVICIGIFAIWITIQIYVAKGALVNVLFCGAIFGTWKIIVSGDENPSDNSREERHIESNEKKENGHSKNEKNYGNDRHL